MKRNKVITYLIVCMFINITLLHAQNDTTKLVKYSPNFKFRDGIYLNFLQVKQNRPIPKSKIISNINYHNINFFDKLLLNKKIEYIDKYRLKQEVLTNKIWGYSRNGTLYINWGNDFNRIPIVGSICHFVATITVYENGYRPYSYYHYNYYNTVPSSQSNVETKQYVLDFETGKILEYNYENILILLMRDEELYDEYNSLRKKKQKQLKFIYLRKYNEKHPLYLPIN
ncbi:MAG: hypothetical protein DRJ01_03580 [Bacteroidetes bacterium]|nr:MAG: hypothetical protein DRJ01_03580 [Bacteroidota bacterium]